MKKTIIISGLLAMLLSACSKDLDNYPLDQFSEDKVWNSAAGAQDFINGTLYVKNHLMDPQNMHSDDWSDDFVINSQLSAASRVVTNTLTSDVGLTDYGYNQFPEIRRCNLAIQKVTESTTISDEDKAYLIAQARFLRGLIYFNLAREYGRCTIIDKVLTPDDELMLGRTETIKETYDFIIQDLQEAAPDLPVAAEAGAISQGAAYALLAEAALQGAAYLESASDKQEYYAISKKASEDLFALGQYSLDSNYYNLFNDFDTGMNSKEVILGSYWLSDNTYVMYTWKIKLVPNQGGAGKLPPDIAAVWPVNDDFEGWCEKTPSQELVNAYQVIDTDGEAKDWDKTSYYQNYRQGTDYADPMLYGHRDARFYATIAYDSCTYMHSLLTMRLGGNMYYTNNNEQDQYMTKSGYYFLKGAYLNNDVSYVFYTDKMNFHLTPLRLGRSYLNYAEVMLRLGDVATAIRYVNQTRTVHGQLPELSTGLSLDEAWKAYKNERRVEMVLENDRYWSLLRWGKEDGLEVIPELNTPPTAVEIAADGKSYRFVPVPVVAAANDRHFTSRRYLLPLPRTEIITNDALLHDQNPGWE